MDDIYCIVGGAVINVILLFLAFSFLIGLAIAILQRIAYGKWNWGALVGRDLPLETWIKWDKREAEKLIEKRRRENQAPPPN